MGSVLEDGRTDACRFLLASDNPIFQDRPQQRLKLVEVRQATARLQTMTMLLKKLLHCDCPDVDFCGRTIRRSMTRSSGPAAERRGRSESPAAWRGSKREGGACHPSCRRPDRGVGTLGAVTAVLLLLFLHQEFFSIENLTAENHHANLLKIIDVLYRILVQHQQVGVVASLDLTNLLPAIDFAKVAC